MAEGSKIASEALARFPIRRAVCRHRVGKLALGEAAIHVEVKADIERRRLKPPMDRRRGQGARSDLEEGVLRGRRERMAGAHRFKSVKPSEDPLEVVPCSLDGFRVVDIREEYERDEEPFPYSEGEWMPLSEWAEFETTRPTLFVCHMGVRSLRLVRYLRGQGHLQVFSLPGGTETLRAILTHPGN